jgi:hypothetical protein
MSMSQFKEEIQKVSVQKFNENQSKRFELSKERDVRMSFQMIELAHNIITGSKDLIMEASENGKFGCSIFECSNNTNYTEDYKSVFLLRGPFHWDSEVGFFETKGMLSVLDMVRDALDPIDVYMKYDRMTMTHKIIAVWKTT